MPAKNKFINTIFSAYYFLRPHLHHFSKIKSQKESQNNRNQGFSYYFCMIIEGSGYGSRAGFGDPDPYLWLVDPDPDPGGPKSCGPGFGSGSATLAQIVADPTGSGGTNVSKFWSILKKTGSAEVPCLTSQNRADHVKSSRLLFTNESGVDCELPNQD